jgi:type IV pilus assembly protein PilM
MRLFGNKKIHAFGLDISDSSIKVAQIGLHKGQLQSAVFADVPLLEKTIVNHLITDESKLASCISKALKTAKNINTKFVICSVPEAKSFVRIINIQKIPASEIEGAIPFELEQDIPIPMDQVYFDWQILHELPDRLELLVTCTSKDYVDSLVSALHSIKLTPVAMEIGSQATARALTGAAQAAKSVLIVDIGAVATSFIIVDQGVPLYTSSIPIAGNSFTDSIARNLSVPQAEAEKIKLSSGVSTQMEHEDTIRQAVLPVLDNIIDEIKNVIRFFEEHSPNHRLIDTILLCGGSSRVPGVMEYISTRINLGSGKLQIEVAAGNPWSNVLPASNQGTMPLNAAEALSFSTAIGLALRGFDYEVE